MMKSDIALNRLNQSSNASWHPQLSETQQTLAVNDDDKKSQEQSLSKNKPQVASVLSRKVPESGYLSQVSNSGLAENVKIVLSYK